MMIIVSLKKLENISYIKGSFIRYILSQYNFQIQTF